MNIDIGSKIKALRLTKSMTQEQLAKALHVSAQAVSKWENNSSLPDIQLLPALSVALGTSIDSLLPHGREPLCPHRQHALGQEIPHAAGI